MGLAVLRARALRAPVFELKTVHCPPPPPPPKEAASPLLFSGNPRNIVVGKKTSESVAASLSSTMQLQAAEFCYTNNKTLQILPSPIYPPRFLVILMITAQASKAALDGDR